MSLRRGFQRAMELSKEVGEKRPYLVASLQTSMLLAIGDVISQNLIEHPSTAYDIKRTLKFSGVGLVVGPGLRVWYGALEKLVGTDKRLISTIKKVALDQVIFSPAMLLLFMSSLSAIDGHSGAEMRAAIAANYTDILLNNYKLWPAVQLINFAFIPLKYRVLFVQSIAVGWNTYLSWKLHHQPHDKQ